MKLIRVSGFLVTGLAFCAVVLVGCAKTDVGAKAENKKAKPVAEAGHDHSGWWCAEHGIPEEECSMCSAKVAAECKKKGDWCEKHDRADSQCFVCHPEYKEKFAAKYRAKYGKEPPPIEDETTKDEKSQKS